MRGVLIVGPYGAGKSTVAAEIADVLERDDVAYALLDLDFLGWANPPGVDVHDEPGLLLENLRSVTRTYAAAGIERFVLAGHVASTTRLEQIREAAGMPLEVVRLDVPWTQIERRLRADVTSGRLEDLEEARRQTAAPEAFAADHVLGNDRPVGETATEMLSLLGWRRRHDSTTTGSAEGGARGGGGAMDLNSVLIGSEEPQRLAAFYAALFGDPVWEGGGYTTWRIGSGLLTVGFHDQVKGNNAEPGRLIWNIESADVPNEFARLKAAGATVVREPYQMGDDAPTGWIATLADPDDNYFQLMSPME